MASIRQKLSLALLYYRRLKLQIVGLIVFFLLAVVFVNIHSGFAQKNTQVEELINEGIEHIELEEYDLALQVFDNVLKIDPNNISALYYKSEIYLEQEKFNPALFYAEKVLEFEPKNIQALNNKGEAFAGLGKYNEAHDSFDKVLEIDSTNIEALINKGKTYLKQGLDKIALDYFNKVLEIDVNNYEALKNVGQLLALEGNYTEAVEVFDKILKLNPDDIETLNRKNSAVIQSFEESVTELEQKVERVEQSVGTINLQAIFDGIVTNIYALFAITIIGTIASIVGTAKAFFNK